MPVLSNAQLWETVGKRLTELCKAQRRFEQVATAGINH